MKKSSLFVVAVTLALGMSACRGNKNDTPQPNPEPAVRSVVIDATAYPSYAYFSFEQGKVIKTVAHDDQAIRDDKSWDLGFHRYEFRTNSGESGKGQGGAAEAGTADLKARVTIPTGDKFEVDRKVGQLFVFDHGQPMNYEESAANLVLTTIRKFTAIPNSPMPRIEIIREGAITQDMSKHGQGGAPLVTLSNKVYIVRTATGKYAKVKIVSHNEPKDNGRGAKTPTTGMIRMDYIYPIN